MLLSLPDIAADSSQSKCRVALLFSDALHGLLLLLLLVLLLSPVISNFVFCISRLSPECPVVLVLLPRQNSHFVFRSRRL